MDDNNQRIAKNTFFLYVRMIVTVIVSLYTSRVVLDVLGAEDYGIYNVVGGVVAMFAFISNTMSSASQRFFAYEIGRKDNYKLSRTFSVTLIIYLIFSIVIFGLGESIGLWFVKNKLTIPQERVDSAILVYQFSLLSFIVLMLRVPYNALVIAHEKMGFFAWTSIVEVTLKLVNVFLLVFIDYDKLSLYGFLILLVVTAVSIIYLVYCRIHFDESRFSLLWDKKLFKKMFDFAGWTLFDSLANVAKNQGVNILLNIFFNPVVNAARGIAFQVSTQVVAFVGNFQIAASPQLIKHFAAGEKAQMKHLYILTSRLSYFLLFIITLPVLIQTEILIGWWLKEIPEYTIIFIQLVLINKLIDSFAGTSNTVVQATGRIKLYQVCSGLIMLLNLPISYIFLSFGYNPESTFIISIIISFILVFVRLYLIQYQLGFNLFEYIRKVILNGLLVSVSSCVVPLYLAWQIGDGIISFLVISSASLVFSSASIYYLGLSKEERGKVIKMLIEKFSFLETVIKQ